MPHDTHVFDGINKDLVKATRQDYLDLAGDWEDPFEPIRREQFEVNGYEGFVARADDCEGGFKARIGDLAFSKVETDTVVYVAPTTGHAGIALAGLAKKYGKRLVLFAPACKNPSKHQRAAANLGADLRWVRIAAMPNLNKIAREWANQNNATFFPLGLYDPLVLAAGAKVARDYEKRYGIVDELWCAISTGVMARSLQIGMSHATDFHVVAVARNLKEGEAGTKNIYSHPYAFPKPEAKKYMPTTFPLIDTYDGKVFRFMAEHGRMGATFWNTAGEPEDQLCLSGMDLDSNKEWGDKSDFYKP